MKFSQYLKFTCIENDNIRFTWSNSISTLRQSEIENILSKIGKSDVGDYYKVPISSFSELYEFDVLAQKFAEDGTLTIMFE